MILKYLIDRIGHPLTAGVVEQCVPFARRIGNDHDMPAFPLQLIDGSKLISVAEEKKVFPNNRASSILPHAVRGEVSGILHKSAHIILHEDLRSWEFA